MKTFEEVKQIMLDRARSAGYCEDGYEMGLIASDKAGLLKAITSNWLWVFHNVKIVDVTFLEEHFTEEELTEAGIYTRKEHLVYTSALACGSATVKAYESATVEAYVNSYVEDCRGGIMPQSDYAIVKNRYAHKIYVKKGKFEIIEVA